MNGDCIVLFSECDFKGDHKEVCFNNRDLGSNFPRTRSVFIPEKFN